MITSRDVVTGLFVAWRLLLFDRSAIRFADTTVEGFWKSFYAAVIALPAVIVLRALFAEVNPDLVAQSSAGRVVAVFILDYAYQWVLFPLIMVSLAEAIGRSGQYLVFIVAHNWAQVIQVAIVLPAAVIFASEGPDGSAFAQLLLLAAHLVTLVYAWFIARTALDIPGMTAALIVFVELVITILISLASKALITGG